MTREIELKLELDASGARRFRGRASRLLGPPEGEARRLASVYFDTRKHKLHRQGYSLRVRQDGEGRIQTLKAENTAGAGMYDRPEWEVEAAGDAPDPAAFGDRDVGDLLASLGPLAPVFETRVDRTTWRVAQVASRIEVVLDEGTVLAGEVAAPIAELELELKSGSAADLFGLARRLAAQGRLRLAVRSKSERGYGLLLDRGPLGIRAEAVRLREGMNAAEAFQAVARSCLRHFRLNEAVLVETKAVEALHQARVALRRLRTAFSLFGDVIADAEVERIKRELRAVSQRLGEARNLDVFAARIAANGAGTQPADPAARKRLSADRELAYDRIIRRLDSARFRIFTLDLAAWIEAGPWLARPETADARLGPVSDFAASVLDRRWRKLRKRGRRLDEQTPEERHQVRIAAKKLRYACEFFAELPRGRKARRRRKVFLGALEALQSCLSDLNDIATGHELAARLASAPRGPKRGAAAVPIAPPPVHDPAREAELLACAVAAHRDVADAKAFWR